MPMSELLLVPLLQDYQEQLGCINLIPYQSFVPLQEDVRFTLSPRL